MTHTTEPELSVIATALEDYRLTTAPTEATPAGQAERVGEYLASSGYVIKRRRRPMRRLMPRGAVRTHRIAYAASALALACAVLIAKVQLWIPALVCVLVSAFLYDLADRHRSIRHDALAAERAARPTPEGTE